jgi:hypothetical protein
MLKRCADAGAPVPVAVIVVSGQAAAHVKALSPKTYTVVRPVWPDYYPMQDGRVRFSQAWFDSFLAPVRPWLQHIDAVQFVNEMWCGNDVSDHRLTDLRDFYMALIRASRAAGTRCTVLDLAAGNMSDARFAPEPDQFGVMRPMLQLAAAEDCPVNYHCYNGLTPQGVYDPDHDPETWVLRPVYWLERVPGLKCVGGESLVPEWKDSSGRDAVLPGDSGAVVAMIRKVDNLWNGAIRSGRIAASQWLGHCPFTDNAGERWKNYDMRSHLAAQAEYLISG